MKPDARSRIQSVPGVFIGGLESKISGQAAPVLTMFLADPCRAFRSDRAKGFKIPSAGPFSGIKTGRINKLLILPALLPIN